MFTDVCPVQKLQVLFLDVAFLPFTASSSTTFLMIELEVMAAPHVVDCGRW